MDFLLECIGFPPETPVRDLVEIATSRGEPVAWRGDPESHRRVALGGGLELRVDREPGREEWTLLPHYRVPHRLRVAVHSVRKVPDSPFDALLTGWAAPPPPGERGDAPGAYLLATWLTDARRLPKDVDPGHVLAINTAGFALHVDFVGPNDGIRDRSWLERPHGAHVEPLGGPGDPGGCSEVSLRIREMRRLRNTITGRGVDLLVTDAPERPLLLFVSPWQLETDGLPPPRPGWRIEGAFLFSGTIGGGVPGPKRAARDSFG